MLLETSNPLKLKIKIGIQLHNTSHSQVYLYKKLSYNYGQMVIFVDLFKLKIEGIFS